ncbi:MAG: hypothetical protein U1F36_16930 [Planctomycetota bacterium]
MITVERGVPERPSDASPVNNRLTTDEAAREVREAATAAATEASDLHFEPANEGQEHAMSDSDWGALMAWNGDVMSYLAWSPAGLRANLLLRSQQMNPRQKRWQKTSRDRFADKFDATVDRLTALRRHSFLVAGIETKQAIDQGRLQEVRRDLDPRIFDSAFGVAMTRYLAMHKDLQSVSMEASPDFREFALKLIGDSFLEKRNYWSVVADYSNDSGCRVFLTTLEELPVTRSTIQSEQIEFVKVQLCQFVLDAFAISQCLTEEERAELWQKFSDYLLEYAQACRENRILRPRLLGQR